MPKYVASRTLREPLAWNATLLKGDLTDPGPGRGSYGAGPVRLELIGATTFGSGVVRLAYRPAPGRQDGAAGGSG